MKRTVLWCLLLADLTAFCFICWLYPYVWAPKPEQESEAVVLTKKYNMHYMVLDYGECIPVYKLKEEFKK